MTNERKSVIILALIAAIEGAWVLLNFYINGARFFSYLGFAPHLGGILLGWLLAIGGTGQFVIGTFTSGDPTEIITFTGTDSTQAPTINAFQLRDLTAVPELSTMSILLLGGTLSGLRLLRRKR